MKTLARLSPIAALALAAAAAHAAGLKVASADIAQGRTLPMRFVYKGFGCAGDNVSPQLSWSGAPAQTKSYAVTVYDPDAPTGSGWWHWTLVNIPATTTSLAAGAGSPDAKLPEGEVSGRNDFGTVGYGGACPPVGDKPHRYRFTVWALKVPHLDVDANSSGALVGYMLHFNSLAHATLTARYGR